MTGLRVPRIAPLLARLRDDRGGPTVEFAVVFAPLMGMLLYSMQVGLSHFFLLSAMNAAEEGARVAATSPIAHCAALRNADGARTYALDDLVFDVEPATRNARACLNDPSPCLPMPGTWTCSTGGGGGACDARVMEMIEDVVRGPGVRVQNITVTYEDSRLGAVGEPVAPLITVTVDQAPLTLRSIFFEGPQDLPSVTATIIGEYAGTGKWEGPQC